MSETLEALAERLRSSDHNERSLAALALARTRDPRALAPLIAALADADGPVRETAAAALGQLGDARAVAALVSLLQDEQTSVRFQAARALGQLGDARAAGPLAAALPDAAYSVRHAAAEALGYLGSQAGEALPALRAAARRGPDDSRWACARAIRQIEEALRSAPAELEAAAAPEGAGTELEAELSAKLDSAHSSH
ncbi:MAG: HEAT repeat domain-containing protein [Armatimonadetes bacterium]|nr:HEAT repeat domain-containing protein [Armatimonadota bacterium]